MGIFNFDPISEVQKGINSLTRIAQKHKTNKTPLLGHSYVPFYYQIFADKNNKIEKVLQIGLGDTEKNSLFFWQDFFPIAKIFGIGNDKKYVYKRGRIQTFLSERTNSSALKSIIKETGSDIDVVVDEGNRTPKEIVSSFQTVMPLLKKDVTYIIENVNRNQANEITANLSNYNYHEMRHHKMISSYDRLIIITNKVA